ncbi:MAG: hypothetical protein V8S27_01305 [Lachnospiraceae bacterium]
MARDISRFKPCRSVLIPMARWHLHVSASGQIDVLCTYADARRDYESKWNDE